jgi:tetratricopeptide (TPR) repeat protein
VTRHRKHSGMKSRRGSAFLCILLASSLHPRPSPLFAEASLADQAQAAWQARSQPGQTEASIRLFRQAAEAQPTNAELWIDLSKALGRAVRHATSIMEKRQSANEARRAAEKAVQLSPRNSEAYTVYGEALGQWAEAHNGVPSLHAVRLAVASLRKALALKPDNAYAHMLLASFYRQSPRIISVGNRAEALEEARLAVQYGPAYAINHLVLARVLLDAGNQEEAISELQKIVSLFPPADAIPETRADQETAQSMLRSMGIAPIPAPCGEPGTGACTEQHL